MIRFLLAAIAIVSFFSTGLFGLDMVVIDSRSGATVFQQLVARMSFGISLLVFVSATGFFGLISGVASLLDAQKIAEISMRETAQAAALSAQIAKAKKESDDAPIRAVEAAVRAEEEETKRAKLAAYRAELQGGTSPRP